MRKQRRPRSLIESERGATAIEYGLLASLLVVATIVAIKGIGGTTTNMWNDVAENVSTSSGR